MTRQEAIQGVCKITCGLPSKPLVDHVGTEVSKATVENSNKLFDALRFFHENGVIVRIKPTPDGYACTFKAPKKKGRS